MTDSRRYQKLLKGVSGNEFRKDKINLQIHLSLPDFSSDIRAAVAAAFWAEVNSEHRVPKKPRHVQPEPADPGQAQAPGSSPHWSRRSVNGAPDVQETLLAKAGVLMFSQVATGRKEDGGGYMTGLKNLAPQSHYIFGSSANSLRRIRSRRTMKKEVRCLKTRSVAVHGIIQTALRKI